MIQIRVRPEAVVSGLRTFVNGIPNATSAGLKQTVEHGFKESDRKVPVITGQLKRSGGVKQVTAERATYGWDADYAAFVNFGTTRRPARHFATPTYRTLENGLAANFIYQNMLRIL